MKQFLTLLLALFCSLSLWGQLSPTVTVSGHITFGSNFEPAVNYPVWINYTGGNQTVYTNSDGIYTATIEGAINDAGFALIKVSVYDFCTAQTQEQVVDAIPGDPIFSGVDFKVCVNTRPPNTGGCGAFFTYKTDSDNPFKVSFQNLSFGTNYLAYWNFGDGTTNMETNPMHTYANGGIYTVTLSIITDNIPQDSCTSNFTTTLYLSDGDDCNCPKNYDPVCVATPNGGFLTFPNKCFALCAGYQEQHLTSCIDTTCICPDIYNPVCVVVNGDTITFSNACEAACQGYKESDFVTCRPNNNCYCPDIYDPVCVVVNGDTLTYSNACFAACAGFTQEDFIQCQPNACLCPPIREPVCVILADGTIQQFDNKCFALCSGFKETDFVNCNDTSGCACPLIYDPVCVLNGDTVLISFPNACIAECNGFTPDDFVPCNPTQCNCPTDEFDPVCVITPNGDIKKYVSPCYAKCDGYTPDQFVRCDSSDCGCPRIYDPVCVLNGDTVLISFPNACVAKCNGFTPEDFVSCVDSSCICPEYYQPVCVVNADGDTITYANPCLASCDGYNESNFVTCPNDSHRDCYADFYVSQEDSTSLKVAFYDKSYADVRTIISWHWDFGDGTTQEGGANDNGSVTHVYERPGLYKVTLIITTADGCTSTTMRQVYIHDGGVVESPTCQAIFLFQQAEAGSNTFHFKDFSIGNVISWKWDFGDGTTSNLQNPTHTYAFGGVFFVKLTVFTPDCQNTNSMIVFVDPNAAYDDECNALFLPLLYVDSLQVYFRNLSSPDAIEFKWDFGDGTTSSDRDPLHTYATTGIYQITLTITTANGCTSSFEGTINLSSQNFTGAPTYRTVTDTNDPEAFSSIRLYPNPVNDRLTLEFNLPKANDYQLSIFTLEGKLIQAQKEHAANGKNTAQIALGDLTPGMYLLRIQSNEHIKTMKFVKQ